MKPHVITLNDSRKLAYAEYGKTDGVPVFFFHGTPGSHLLPDSHLMLAKRFGLRLIAPVRPGYGLSDFQPHRTLLDWPDDVVALADALGITLFGVIGISGGGPFVTACAYKIPERLTQVVLMSSLGPFEFLNEQPQPMTRERREFKKQQIEAEPDTWFDTMVVALAEPDRVQLTANKAWMIAGMREAYRQGVEGTVYEETLLLTRSWGFPLEAIPTTVYLWQGEADKNVPLKHGQYLARHIPSCVASYLPEVGHMMPEVHLHDIFSIFVGATE